MSEHCDVCGGELPAAGDACPACAESTFRPPPVAPSGAGELSQWSTLGWKPASVMDAVRAAPDGADGEGAEAALAETPVERSGNVEVKRSLRRAGLFVLVLLVALLAAARLLGTLDREPGRTDWPTLHAPDILAELRDVVPEVAPVWEPDVAAAMAALEARAPDAVRIAKERHVPLTTDVAHAHDLMAEACDRFAALDATWGLWLGGHPHPDRLAPVRDVEVVATGLLLQEIHAWCAANPPEAATDVHERTDRALLARMAATALHDLDSDATTLAELSSVVMNLWQLVVIDCCPADERRALLTSCLLDLPDYLKAAVAMLRRPERDACHAAADVLRYESQRVRRLARAFGGGDRELAEAARIASAALGATAVQLAEWPDVTTARDAATRRREQARYLADVAWETGGRYTPREMLDIALRELRQANAVQVAAVEAGYTAPTGAGPIREPAERIRRLRDAAPRWVGEIEGDPGVVFRAVVDASVEWAGLLYAPGPRAPPVASAFVGTWPDRSLRAEDAEYEKRSRQHLAAHETYPGHHLHALLSRDTCLLRRALPSAFVGEGWAMYAEDLVHETGLCGPDVMDDYVRGEDRASRALAAALEILHACGDHDAEDLARRLGMADDAASLAWVRQSVIAGYSTPYLFGRLEIEHLRADAERRAGEAFDLRVFHRRLLTPGAIPSPLLGAELDTE